MQANENKIIINKIGSFEIANGSIICYQGIVEFTAIKTSKNADVVIIKTLFNPSYNVVMMNDLKFCKNWEEAEEYMSQYHLFSDMKWRDINTNS